MLVYFEGDFMKTMKQNICAIIAAFIWGSAFVAQDKCSAFIGPFTVNALRGIVAFAVLLVIVIVGRKTGFIKPEKNRKKYNKKLIKGGIWCGIALSIASNLQQAGIAESGAGKSAFITAMYVVIVPILGIFLKKKAGANVWAAVFISVIGFYFLCLFGEGLRLSTGDLLVLLCSIIFAVHILIIDSFSDVNGIELSCVQFAVVAVTSTLCMFVFETPVMENILQCILPILYVGIFSSGVAYTLQIISLKDANPTVITLLLSLESVFAIIVERLIPGFAKGPMMWWEILGCVLIFVAVIISQIQFGKDNL